MEKKYLHAELTKPIIGAAFEVNKILGCGFLESVYEEAFALELELQALPFERQKGFNVVYKGKTAKSFISDFIVSEFVVVELKAIREISEIEQAQILNYLKVTGLPIGLILNFGSNSLQIKRFLNPKSV